MPRYSKNAFVCAKCPEKGGDGGCPMWWETVWTQPAGSGPDAIKTVKSCGFEQMPQYLVEVIKASNRPAAAVESMRNEMSRGLFAIAQASQAMPQRLLSAEQTAPPQITARGDSDGD